MSNIRKVTADFDPARKGPFGELTTAHKTPIVQIDDKYGIDPAERSILEVFSATGGSVSSNNNLFNCQTGTSLGGYGVVRSKATLNYKAGQGIEAQFTAKFTTGIPLSLQFGGMFSLTETLAFGYDGADFSCLHSYNGAAEIQLITVTATGAGTTTVTLDNDAVGITTTAGTVQTVAEEIRAGLEADVTINAKWRVEQDNDRVYCISRSTGNKTGTMSVSGASTCTIIERATGADKVNNHTAQADWNREEVFAGFDPTKLNIYKVRFGYLGAANIDYFIYDPSLGDFVLVHSIEWANSNVITHLGSPDLKVGWTSASLGATGTNLTVEGASASLMFIGDEVISNESFASESTTTVGTTFIPLLTIKNRIIFGDKFNLGKLSPLRISIDNDHTKGLVVEVFKNAVLGGTPNFQFKDEFNSIATIDTSASSVSNGEFVDGFTIDAGGDKVIALKDITPEILPEETLTFEARTVSGTGATVTLIVTWAENK